MLQFGRLFLKMLDQGPEAYNMMGITGNPWNIQRTDSVIDYMVIFNQSDPIKGVLDNLDVVSGTERALFNDLNDFPETVLKIMKEKGTEITNLFQEKNGKEKAVARLLELCKKARPGQVHVKPSSSF